MFQKHKPMCGHHDGQAALSWVPVMPSGARLGSLLSGTLNPPAPLSHPIPSEGLSWGASMPTSPPVSRPRALVSTQGYMCSQHRETTRGSYPTNTGLCGDSTKCCFFLPTFQHATQSGGANGLEPESPSRQRDWHFWPVPPSSGGTALTHL